MNFDLTEEQKMIARSAREIAGAFGPAYWREKEEQAEFPEEFWRTITSAGFTGIFIPTEYGGAGGKISELIIAIEELCANGCGMGGGWFIVMSSVFGGLSILKHGTEEQKRKYLPGIASGQLEFCMALTEPDAGSNTLNTRTTARKEGSEWVIDGNKTWITLADRAKGMFIIARTTPKEKAPKKTLGLSLFLADLPNPAIEIKPIPKHGMNYSHSCEIWFDSLRLPESALIPPQDQGWYMLVDTLDVERMCVTAECIGIARLAMSKAVEYSKGRKVFDDVPIGSYQGLQFPIAESYAALEAAKLLNFKAASLFDSHADIAAVGAAAAMAMAVAVENGIKAVYWAMQIFGGYGFAKEYDIERWWREINLNRLGPITYQMNLNYIGQHVVGMPRAY